MKLGLLFGGPNVLRGLDRDLKVYNTHIFSLVKLLYPSEVSGSINVKDPDFELMKEFDALFYIGCMEWNKYMVEYINDIPCQLLTYPDGTPEWPLRFRLAEFEDMLKVTQASDLVIVPDIRKEYINMTKIFAGSKVASWLFPMPVDAIINNSESGNGMESFDIIVPYGPFLAQNQNRGGYQAAVVAQKLVDQYSCFRNFAVLNFVSPSHSQFDKICSDSERILCRLGCKDFKLLSFVEWEDVLCLYKNTKLVLNLNWSPAVGRIAAECALLKTPYIGTDTTNYGYYIYGDICTVRRFDIDAVVELAGLVDKNQWPKGWLDKAYNKALTLSLSNSASALEELVCGLC